MSVYKRFALIFACFYIGLPLCLLALCALLWLYDPFMFFHKPLFREQTYHSDMRIQARGIIDFTEFDSVILGTSLIKNTSAKEAGEKLGGKWVNLSLDGSTFKERATVVQYILNNKELNQIIYSIDAFTLINDYDFNNTTLIDSALYKRNSSLQRFKKYLNKKFIKCALKWSSEEDCVGKGNLETLNRWPLEDQKQFGGFSTWIIWIKKQALEAVHIDEKGIILPSFNEQERQQYIKDNIFYFCRNNPQIKFYFIVPPHQRFFYKLPMQKSYHQGRTGKQFYAEYKKILIWFIKESAQYKNVKIYGFDTTDYPDNILNYRDSIHYNVDMNSMQLDAIANGTHILTPENIDEYLQTMENKIKVYDLAPLIREIKEWEAKFKQNKK